MKWSVDAMCGANVKTWYFLYPMLLLNLVLTGCETTAEEDRVASNQYVRVVDRAWNSPEIPDCGSAISIDAVQVIDLESPGHEQQLSQLGGFELVREKPIAVTASGSRIDSELKAVRFAARKGCNLLLLGPIQEEMQTWTGNDAAGGTRMVRYLLFRMGNVQG
jgi:hypothetical protein